MSIHKIPLLVSGRYLQNHVILYDLRNLGKRHTIVLDEKLEAKLRTLQANQIRKSGGYVSFSAVINQLLTKSLK
jgi:hypothetical protein